RSRQDHGGELSCERAFATNGASHGKPGRERPDSRTSSTMPQAIKFQRQVDGTQSETPRNPIIAGTSNTRPGSIGAQRLFIRSLCTPAVDEGTHLPRSRPAFREGLQVGAVSLDSNTRCLARRPRFHQCSVVVPVAPRIIISGRIIRSYSCRAPG